MREREDDDERRGSGDGGAGTAVSASVDAEWQFLGEAPPLGRHFPAQSRDPVPPGPLLPFLLHAYPNYSPAWDLSLEASLIDRIDE